MQTIKTLAAQIFTTPIGKMLGGFSENALHFLEFTDEKSDKNLIDFYEQKYSAKIIFVATKLSTQLTDELQAYFTKNLKSFTLPVAFVGTEFQKNVWESLQSIKYGETISYSEQAKGIGNLKAVRAVAAANSLNPVAIVVPCHRVIGKNGSLTGYAGGLHRKQFLLDLERHTSSIQTSYDMLQ